MQLEVGKKYTVTLSAEEIGLIQNALVEIPYKYSAQLINDLPSRISEVKVVNESVHDVDVETSN